MILCHLFIFPSGGAPPGTPLAHRQRGPGRGQHSLQHVGRQPHLIHLQRQRGVQPGQGGGCGRRLQPQRPVLELRRLDAAEVQPLERGQPPMRWRTGGQIRPSRNKDRRIPKMNGGCDGGEELDGFGQSVLSFITFSALDLGWSTTTHFCTAKQF